jgi:hypothetical protein
MKLNGLVLASSLGALSLLQLTPSASGQAASPKLTNGIWQGVAKVRDTEIPITIRISGSQLHSSSAAMDS